MRRRSRAKETVAIAPKINLEIRFADRPAVRRSFGPGRMAIGRESGDIILGDKETSALHAELEFTQGRVIVRDLGSRNGTLKDGQALPQFALFPGQSFRCGGTDIVLLAMEGVGNAPRAGSTAVGADRVDEELGQSFVGLQSPNVHESASTLPEGASPTLPGAGAPHGTILAPGAPPPPGGPRPPALRNAVTDMDRATVNPSTLVPTHDPADGAEDEPSGPFHVASLTIPKGMLAPEPGDGTQVAPSPILDAGEPAVVSGATQTAMPVRAPDRAYDLGGAAALAAVQAAAPGATPLQAPAPGPTASAAPPPAGLRGPVANAVIKPGEVDLGPKKRKAKRSGPSMGRIVKWLVAGTLGLAAVGGVAFLIYTLVVGRGQAFFAKMADELPQDAVGVIAAKSPKAMLTLLGDDVPAELAELAKTDIGFDPFDVAAYEALGVDVDAPVAIGLLSGDGIASISIGVTDRDLLKESLSKILGKAIAPDLELRWIERAYEDVPGMWLDEPIPVAVLWPDGRAIFVAGGSADEVARHAKAVAKAPQGDSLADRPGFAGIVQQPGKLLAAAYIDGASGRAALQRPGAAEVGMLMATSDIDGFALSIVDDGPRIDFASQAIIRDGAAMLEVLSGPQRDPKALSSIPTPVLASIDARIDAASLYRTISTTPLGLGLKQFEDEFKQETGLDLRADVLENMTGEYGAALLNLPTGDAGDDWAAVAWVGLGDDDKAKKSLERFFASNQSKLELEQTAGTTVYVDKGFFRTALFVHGGQLWIALGKADIAAIVGGPSKSMLTDVRVPQIGKALEKGGLAAGFFDARQFLFSARSLMNESEREREKAFAPVLSPIEVVTFRSEIKERTIIGHFTVHTTWEHALASLAESAIEVAGKELALSIERKRRVAKCADLIDHLMVLMRKELGEEAVAEIEFDTRTAMLDECLGPETTVAEIDCMLVAETLDGLSSCEGRTDDGTTPAVIEEGEPTAVPFIDDIWPNTKPTGSGNGRPDPSVNYGVGTGEEPQARGADNALVTIVMFGDFQCPYCKRVLGTLDEVMAKHGKDVRIVFRHNPLPMHAEARAGAKAALAAGKQGKFWPMHDKLFDNQSALTESNFQTWAADMGLDVAKFERDYADRFSDTQIDDDVADAQKFGARVTPSFFVNGRYTSGAQPLHVFDALISEELERAKKFVERRGNTRKGLYADMVGRFAPEVTKPPPTPIATPKTGTRYTIETGVLPRKGSTGIARVEIVECGDFDCAFCKRSMETMKDIVRDYSTNVSLYWLHNPLSFHPGAEPAARAAVAAANQDKFWEMHDKLFEDKSLRARSDFETMASDLGLDVAQFLTDFDAPETLTLVQEQQKTCSDNDARGTPSFFVNGRLVTGAQSYDAFKVVIEEELSGGI